MKGELFMQKTRAELFRQAKTGNLYLELIKRYNTTIENPIKRHVVKTNTTSLFLENPDKTTSMLEIPKAALMSYEDDCLAIYNAGFREPTADEQKILDNWHAITQTDEYQKILTQDIQTDSNSTYYRKVAFFQKHNAEHLLGFRFSHGCCLSFDRYNNGEKDFICDNNVKGQPILIYRVYQQ